MEIEEKIGSYEVDVEELCPYPSKWITVQPGPINPDIIEELERHSFDQAPVVPKPRPIHPDVIEKLKSHSLDPTKVVGEIEQDPIGLVTTSYLRDLLNRGQELRADDPVVIDRGHHVSTWGRFVDVDLPFEWLADRSAVLVWSRDYPWIGLLTISDLNEHSLRGPLYALLSSLEMSLSKLVERNFTDPWEWLDSLSEENQVRILGYWELSKKKGVDIGPLAATTLPQLLNIVARRKDLRALLGMKSRNEFESHTGHLAELRNSVMHPVRPLILHREDVRRVLNSVRASKELQRAVLPHVSVHVVKTT